MLGIIIGVGAVVAMLSIGAGAQQSIIQSVQGIGSNLIIITPGNPEEEQNLGAQFVFSGQQAKLKTDDLQAIEREATLITGAAPVVFSSSIISYSNNSGQSTVYASTENGRELYNMDVEKGKFYSKSDVSNASNVAVIGQTVTNKLFGKIDPIGKIIKIDGKNFKVIGTLEARGTDTFGNDHDDFSVRNQTQILDVISTITNIFTVVIAGIASISLLVGGIGIMNIMLVSVTERTREIGIRKAIGAKNRDILIQFLVESIVLSITGGIFGILFAVLISVLLSNYTVLETSVTALPIIIR